MGWLPLGFRAMGQWMRYTAEHVTSQNPRPEVLILTIKVISIEICKSLVKGLFDPRMPSPPELACDLQDDQSMSAMTYQKRLATYKNLRPRYTRGTDTCSNFFFVTVGPGKCAMLEIECNDNTRMALPSAVNMPVSRILQCKTNGIRHVFGLRLPGA